MIFNTCFRREVVSKEEEIEEARASANKKVKILEQQLEQVLRWIELEQVLGLRELGQVPTRRLRSWNSN